MRRIDSRMLSLFLLFIFPRTLVFRFFFFFNDTATTEIYTLSLHDALPISRWAGPGRFSGGPAAAGRTPGETDRKSTRLNSRHQIISYALFFLKKKKKRNTHTQPLNPSCQTAQHLAGN